jgi:hypothetical protein
MTGYQSKRAAAQDKLDDDDIQVYQKPWQGLTDEDMKDPKTHNFDFIYGARWAEAKLKERNNG